MKLPHLDVLHREPGAQCHADAVTGIDVGVGGRGVDAPGTAGGKNRGAGFDVDRFAGFHADRDHADHGAILVFHQVNRKPFVQERRLVLQVGLEQGVQQGMAGTVRRCTGARGLATLAVVLALPSERALVDASFRGTRKRQPEMLHLENRLRPLGTHVFDRVLVADVVRSLDGVVHMPAPVIIGIVARDRTGDTALGGHGVRAGRIDLRDHRGAKARLRQLERRAHPGATATDDHAIEADCANSCHRSVTPQDLDTPDEIHEQHQRITALEHEA